MPVKKITETMKVIPATIATHAAALKTLGILYANASDGRSGATAVEVRVVGVSEISLMKRMMPVQTVVAAMRYLCSGCERRRSGSDQGSRPTLKPWRALQLGSQ
jgi:hypothetical protein